MQFIDINCMIGEWAYSNLAFKTAEQLLNEMQRLNIKKSLVFHSRSWLYDQKSGNQEIVAETKGSTALIPVISLTALVDQEFGGRNAIVDCIKQNGIGAVRLFPNDHQYTLNLWNIDKLFSILEELRIPVLLDCRQMEGGIDFQKIYDIARNFEKVPIILLSTGYRLLRTIYPLLDKCGNIYMDSSTLIPFHGIEDVVKHFGSGRIIFGSRMPFIEAGVSVGRITYGDLSQEDKERIAYGNILDMLKKLTWLEIEGET